jgi:hypothetical protein
VLACYLEDEGLPTALISLIRLHTEKVGSPRALWVPFELGRPLGPPNDAPFQRRVLLALLGLLEATDGPTILRDFPEDSPDAQDDPAWACPVELPPALFDAGNLAALQSALEQEIARVRPWYDRAVARWGRTTVGLSGLGLVEVLPLILAYLAGHKVESPRPGMRAVQVMRFAVDDLKAYYLEAATADAPGRPSSRQLANWFWDATLAGKLVFALREASMTSEDKLFNIIGARLLVPGVQLARLA